MSRRDDLARLEDMLAAARTAAMAIEGRTVADLHQDRIWTLGLLKSLEIIGEAAARVQPETRARSPQVPWSVIVATRNRVVHGYFEIDYEQIWKALVEDLPPLIRQIEEAIEKERLLRGLSP